MKSVIPRLPSVNQTSGLRHAYGLEPVIARCARRFLEGPYPQKTGLTTQGHEPCPRTRQRLAQPAG